MLTRFHKLTIGGKLHAINLLIVGLITLLAISTLSGYMYITMRDDYRNNSQTVSSLLAESVTSALLFGDKKSAQEALSGLRTVAYVTHAELYDQAGDLFTAYVKAAAPINAPANPPPKFDSPKFDPAKFNPAKFNPASYQPDIYFGNLTFDSAFPIHSIAQDKEQIGTLALHLDLSDAYAQLAYQIIALLLIGLLGAALVSLALSKLQKSITLPLRALTETMRKVSEDNQLSERATPTGQDEIGELASVFNQMVNELTLSKDTLHQELKERRHIEAKLSKIAHYDAITHLPNRHSFNTQIDRVLLNYKHEHEKFALLYIDLDNFKYVNDTFGHHVGDLLLGKTAERLRTSLRQEDFIARLGGDEFVIIISAFTDTTQIGAVADKILTALQGAFTLDGHEAFVGASIGIAICPDHGKDSETLQRHADNAMYRAKTLGKNNFQFYQDELSRTQKNRISIDAQLRRALERKEIVVYYQPIVELSSSKIVGFEALVRWIKQNGTVIRPGEFIPLAEEIGLIIDIGKFVLDTSTAQTALWVERFGLEFTAVNFSTRQFKHPTLSEDVYHALQNARLQPRHFEMEITETVLMDNSTTSMKLLDTLINQGMGIAIDDFGTGYSSLSYITSFPISKIKIDQSFTAKLPDDKNALAVVTAIIGLAKSLNLKVVAEGIETQQQLDCLATLGCQYGQGYLFSEPLPALAATQLLEARNTRPAPPAASG